MAVTAAIAVPCAYVSIRFMSKDESAMSISLWYHTASVLAAIPLAVSLSACCPFLAVRYAV